MSNPSNVFKRCGCGGRSLCLDSRSVMGQREPYIRRRYKCESCGNRFTTVEHVVEIGQGNRWRDIRKPEPTTISPELTMALRKIAEHLPADAGEKHA